MSPTPLRWAVALCCLVLLSSASAHTASELPPVVAPQPASEPASGPAPSNHTNETPPPSNNSTYVEPPTLTPPHQNVTRRWNETAPFKVVVGNPANATETRTVYVSGRAPGGWILTLNATNFTLAPGESATVRGEVRLGTPLMGESGTVTLQATASNRSAYAFVHVCFEGLLQACGDNATNGTSPPTNETQPPQNETRPPDNRTQPPTNETRPPDNRTDPPTNETRTPPNGTRPPTNETQASRPEEPAPPAPRAAEVEAVVRVREADAAVSLRL